MKTALYLLTALCLAACTPKHSPVADRIAVSGGGNIYYEEMGTGPAVILLHGHSLDTRMWDEQFPVFAKNQRKMLAIIS